jgi:hypothetical protein
MVRVFADGKLVGEIMPELWLMDHFNVELAKRYTEDAWVTSRPSPQNSDDKG